MKLGISSDTRCMRLDSRYLGSDELRPMLQAVLQAGLTVPSPLLPAAARYAFVGDRGRKFDHHRSPDELASSQFTIDLRRRKPTSSRCEQLTHSVSYRQLVRGRDLRPNHIR